MKRVISCLALASVLAGCAQAGPATTAQTRSFDSQRVSALSVAVTAGDKARFRQADRDGDGALTPAELPLLAPEAFAALDGDRDGRLSYAEAISRMPEAARRAEEAADFATAADLHAPELAQTLTARVAEGAAEPAAPTAAAKGNPVILVPGFLDLEVYFALIKKRLRAQGRDTTYLDLFPNVADIRAQAASLKKLVAEVKARTGAKQVDIVAHSMGGLISRHYIKELAGEGHVERLVMLATPNHGTIVSFLAPTAGAKQMHPGSDFLNGLNAGDETHGRVKYTSIRGGLDEIVIPHSSPILEGAENHYTRFAAHGSIMVDPPAWRFLDAALKK
ncbi:MAG: alpha/beta fold hydrolase [Candidatus Sericytochromatia bacterium]